MPNEQHLFWQRYLPSTNPSRATSALPSRAGSQVNLNDTEKLKHLDGIDLRLPVPDDLSYLVPTRERIKHFTWAWFTLPMSTGGLALPLHNTPNRFPGLETIGKVVYIFDLVIFLSLCAMMATRFIMNPGALKKSLMHPTESLFFATFFLAFVSVVSCMQIYGGPSTGPWLTVVVRVLFWIYVAATFTTAVSQYLVLFSAKRLTIQSMTPGWVLPIFPIMLTVSQREAIIVAGITFQGLGWMVAFMVYAIYMHRLMQFGLPAPNLRPGMFIAVGPPSFTGLALIGLSQALHEDMGDFQARPGIIIVLQTMADFIAIFLWCLSLWFFCIAMLSVLGGVKKMTFHLAWWAFVFPNVGFTIATIRIGEQLGSEGILWVASIMTILLVAMWIFVLVAHVRAVWMRQIMMPGVDEDKEDYKANDRKNDIPVPPDHQRRTMR
ncbi:Malic acid transport protein [Fulvia fulva]|uniref:Malic acid transport protein n=1 Tax=Passalora fulva TaxID=5499 RepID=A0A9Q8UWS1_PASFU|nr:Malic acid transport protein [Fulvia fulva]KAK4609908.1 Malic acid transport protein [Fulvia fulva]UJO25316.1 Malic acid transport protein [Fulvia fulva]WPV22415.1 Malic acid transport protein [Fulvia fulva]